MRAAAMWERFREKTFPRHVAILREILDRKVPVDVDWRSLGEEPRLDEALDYDLEMLARALEGVDTHSPFADSRDKVDPARLRTGIERIRIQRVRRPENCRVLVERGTLHVDFLWQGTGRFTAREIESLLLDREGEAVSRRVNAPDRRLPGRLEEVRRNRLPALLRRLESALRRPVPLDLDWSSLDEAPDAPSRLVLLLGKTAEALRKLSREDPGTIVGPESVPERARAKARERSAAVRASVESIRVRGGRVGEDPVGRLAGGVLDLVVFQDEEYVPPPREDGWQARPVTAYYKFPGCRAKDIEAVFLEQLDLEVGPVLRQMQTGDLPQARAYLPKYIDALIGKCDHLGLRDRHSLRKLLQSTDLALEVDWESFLAPESVEDRLAALKKIETGHYNYNCHHGELFTGLMFALREAFERAPAFPFLLLSRVRAIRYEQVEDPAKKELIAVGSTLVLRQCLTRTGGELSDPSDLAVRLIAAVDAIPDPGAEVPEEAQDPIGAHVRRIAGALGGDVEVSVDPRLETADPKSADDLVDRVLAPLRATFRILLSRPHHARRLREFLRGLRIEPADPTVETGCSLRGRTLVARCRPEAGPSGFPAGEDLVHAVDDALALRVRAGIEEIERENHGFWERMLRERFEREVPVEVDWDTFLAHPEQGGNRLYPLHVSESGVLRLIYALTGWMDDDEPFRGRARETVEGLLVTSAPDEGSRGVYLDEGVIVLRCHSKTGLLGFLTIDEIQMILPDLLAPDAKAGERFDYFVVRDAYVARIARGRTERLEAGGRWVEHPDRWEVLQGGRRLEDEAEAREAAAGLSSEDT